MLESSCRNFVIERNRLYRNLEKVLPKMGTDQQVHRAGALKQKNKSHKTGRHRSKGAIDNEQKGGFDCLHLSSMCS